MRGQFSGDSSPAAIREAIWGAVEALRAELHQSMAQPGAITFAWAGNRYWVDRVRLVALEATYARRLVGDDAVTMSEDVLAVHESIGSRAEIVRSKDFVELWAAWLRDGVVAPVLADVAASFMSYAILQPIVNPAFASLFWLGISSDLRLPPEPAERLADVLGEMVFDQRWYPESRSEAPLVRSAQVELLRRSLGVDVGTVEWGEVSDEVWAHHCAEVLRDQTAKLDTRVFDAVRAELRQRELGRGRGQ